MKEIRHDFATYDFKARLAQLTQRVEQMPDATRLSGLQPGGRISRRDIHHGKQYVKRSPMRESVSQGYRKSTGQALNCNVLPQPAIAQLSARLRCAECGGRFNRSSREGWRT